MSEDRSTAELLAALLTEQMIAEADAETTPWQGNPERHAQLKASLLAGLAAYEANQDAATSETPPTSEAVPPSQTPERRHVQVRGIPGGIWQRIGPVGAKRVSQAGASTSDPFLTRQLDYMSEVLLEIGNAKGRICLRERDGNMLLGYRFDGAFDEDRSCEKFAIKVKVSFTKKGEEASFAEVVGLAYLDLERPSDQMHPIRERELRPRNLLAQHGTDLDGVEIEVQVLDVVDLAVAGDEG